jgi:hypothetical protein
MKKLFVLALLCSVAFSYAGQTEEQKAACDSMVNMIKCLNKMLPTNERKSLLGSLSGFLLDRKRIEDLELPGLVQAVSDVVKKRRYAAPEDHYKELKDKTEKAEQLVDNVQNECIRKMVLALIEEN